MPEHTELGSDLGQLADNLLWQMRNYLNAVHSRLAAVEAALEAKPSSSPRKGNGDAEE
jgi:hypothetical protein